MPLQKPSHIPSSTTAPIQLSNLNQPPQVYTIPHHNGNFQNFSSPPQSPPAFSPYQSPPSASYSSPPPLHPGMNYGQPPVLPLEHQPWVLLGFQEGIYNSKAVYGPPGAHFDSVGNIYIQHPNGAKEYVTPYRGYTGERRNPPNPDDECCGLCGVINPASHHDFQSTRFQIPPQYRSTYGV